MNKYKVKTLTTTYAADYKPNGGGEVALVNTEDFTYYRTTIWANNTGSHYLIGVADFLHSDEYIIFSEIPFVILSDSSDGSQPVFPVYYFNRPKTKGEFLPILASQEYFDSLVQNGKIDLTTSQKGHGSYENFVQCIFSTRPSISIMDLIQELNKNS